jgi:thiamine kinase-like enzyme
MNEAYVSVFGNEPDAIQLLSVSNLGNCTFKAISDDKNVKLYEVFSEDYAHNLMSITNMLIQRDVLMPEVYGTYENTVISEWVDGKGCDFRNVQHDSRLVDKLARYQASIHDTKPAEELHLPRYSYRDILFERFRFYGSKYTSIKRLDDIIASVEENRPASSLSITHPDITFQNVLVCNDELVVIDNETLCVDFGYEYDILSTARYLFPSARDPIERYLRHYAKHNSLGTLESHPDYWDSVYAIRVAGKLFQFSNQSGALRVLNELEKGISG